MVTKKEKIRWTNKVQAYLSDEVYNKLIAKLNESHIQSESEFVREIITNYLEA